MENPTMKDLKPDERGFLFSIGSFCYVQYLGKDPAGTHLLFLVLSGRFPYRSGMTIHVNPYSSDFRYGQGEWMHKGTREKMIKAGERLFTGAKNTT